MTETFTWNQILTLVFGIQLNAAQRFLDWGVDVLNSLNFVKAFEHLQNKKKEEKRQRKYKGQMVKLPLVICQ